MLLKTASKCTQTYNFGDKNIFFLGGASHHHHIPPPWRLWHLTPPYWNPKHAAADVDQR